MRYVQPDLLEELCSPDSSTVSFGTQLVEVLSFVLDMEVTIRSP